MQINTICLCGSTRFIDQFDLANKELSKRGLTVITISMCLPKNEQGNEDEAALKELLDLVHLNKILRADAVFVVGDGYIGRSTSREILWADMQGKPIVEQRDTHSWDNAVHCLRAGYWTAATISKAKRTLGLKT
jgi:hypothetical protein